MALMARVANGQEWVKTPRGWVLTSHADPDYTPTCSRIENSVVGISSQLINNNREVSQGRNVKVMGTKLQRRVSECLSELVDYLDLPRATTDPRRQTYVYDIMSLLMKDYLGKISSTTHRLLFKMLETMVNEAIQSELNIKRMKVLLVNILKTMVTTTSNTKRIGCKGLWNRHIQTITNLCTTMEQFSFTERKEDGLPCLTDLPKECIRDIMLRLSDHRDILHLGQTCSDLYYMSHDSSIWQKLTQTNFTEKQMMTFIGDTDDVGELAPWQHLYKSCYKKYGVKVSYTDRLVICSACKTLHWMMLGHSCWTSSDRIEAAYLEPVTPEELVNMANL